MKNFFNQLKLYEWAVLVIMITLTISLPFALNLVQDNVISFALALIASISTIIATVIIAKGKRWGVLLDIIAVVCISTNLIWYATITQEILGIVFLCFVLPCIFIAFHLWGKQKNNKNKVIGKKLTKKNWTMLGIVWIFVTIIIVLSTYFSRTFSSTIEIVNWIFEIFSTSTLIVLMYLYVNSYSEFWILWIVSIFISFVLYGTNYALEPNSLAIIQFTQLSIEILLAVYGLYHWKFKNVSNAQPL